MANNALPRLVRNNTENHSEQWKQWISSFQIYLKATEVNKKDESVQIVKLLHYGEPDLQKIYSTFKFTEAEKGKLAVVIKKFYDRFSPRENLTFLRYNFIISKQSEGMTFEDFITDLRKQAQSCNFGELCDELIKLMLICGTNNGEICHRLLQEDDADLENAIKIGPIIEQSKTQANKIKSISQCELTCEHNNNKYNVKFFIVNDLTGALLGLKTCMELRLIRKNDDRLRRLPATPINSITDEVFAGIGCINPPYHIQLVEKQPTISPIRKVPFALMDKLKETLRKLEEINIIKRVNGPSDWGVAIDSDRLQGIIELPEPKCKKDIQRLLAAVNYVSKYVPNFSEGTNPGCIPTTAIEDLENNYQISVMNEAQISDKFRQKIKVEMANDRELLDLAEVIKNEWPHNNKTLNNRVRPYFRYKGELTMENGMIYRNNSCVILSTLRKTVLEKIHYSHLGYNKCFKLAQESVFWPTIKNEIKQMIDGCHICQNYAPSQTPEHLRTHEIPGLPWAKISCGLFEWQGIHYLIAVDYYSKYVESMFARFGIPQVVSDGGTQLTSREFANFSKQWQFKHIVTSPIHSQSNGMTEHHVQTAKNLVKKVIGDKKDLYLALLHLPTRKPLLPFKGNKLKLHIINGTEYRRHIRHSQGRQAYYYNFKRGARKLPPVKPNAKVLVQLKPNSFWQPGTIRVFIKEGSSSLDLTNCGTEASEQPSNSDVNNVRGNNLEVVSDDYVQTNRSNNNVSEAAEQSTDTTTSTDRIRIMVSYDMGWSKTGSGRNYDSNNGYGALIGCLSGCVLGYGTKNSKCRRCGLGYNQESYDNLITKSRILENARFEVGVLVGDDDSSTIAAVRLAANHKIAKFSDMNHTNKGVKKHLYNIQRKHKELTKDAIKYLQPCFSYAVAQNKENKVNMANSIRQILDHAFNNHQKCGRWCGYQHDKENYQHKIINGGFAEKSLYEALIKICNQLANNVGKFVNATSSQLNENLNAMMASKVPKSHCYNGKNANLSQKKVEQVCGLLKGIKLTQNEIAAQVGVSRSSVKNIKKKMESNASLDPSRKGHCGRPRITTARTDGKIRDICLDNRKKPLRMLTKKIQDEGIEVSERTMRRCLAEKILQIAAKYEENLFEIYITPTKPISAAASNVNHLTSVNGELFYHEKIVPSKSILSALLDIHSFLKSIGFTDTLPIFKHILNGKNNCSQTYLAKEFLGISDNETHNAVQHAIILKSLVEHLKITEEDLKRHRHKETSVSIIQKEQQDNVAKVMIKTLMPLEGVIFTEMKRKMSKASITLSNLVDTYMENGRQGLIALLASEMNEKVRVTKNKYIIELQQRSKWRSRGQQTLQIGQMVLMKEDDTPPLCWRMGRIVRTFPGAGGEVGVVCLLTIVVPQISSALPTYLFDQNATEVSSNIKLADPSFNESRPIDLLLRAYIF
ncbi:hypothetical protein ILUMI_20271 [Ignelater luminosus]|uniref:RNA-directed DNA polymerase n=1 Tax=Ignelater luminosus TaxID=2038154 RepID=A0A8K0CGP0_IGNLU|nr:hypothetical protein ILUMI_20271 [Ignelater luminosus]